MDNVNATVTIDNSKAPPLAVLRGSLTRNTVRQVHEELRPLLDRGEPINIDAGGVTEIDSAGVALFAYGFNRLGTGQSGFALKSMSYPVERALKLTGWDYEASTESLAKPQENFIVAAGQSVADAMQGVYYFLYLLSEIFYQGVVAPFRGVTPRYRIFLEQMARLGAGSAPIVCLVSLLVGLTTAYQSAYELRQFGANIYVADVISISMMIELGPLMAAILVAGRSGSAITAEIGTMAVTEEIDALKLIGINPIQYLAVPRIYAVVITQALLGVSAAIIGIVGGFIIGVSFLDLSPAAFINESLEALVLADLLRNLSKSMVFGFLIVSVGVFCGLKVSGGAEGVGKATTNSVVMAIFLIIIADCIFSFI